ncbi:hypothetical protein DIPPA_28323 [Diplonema papillatum]|nr:hypothetical protein DIPPA_28323 [Diplonema papillatum]
MGYDSRMLGLGFRMRSWITRRAMQRHLWKPGQHTIGLFGLSRVGFRRLQRFMYCVAIVSTSWCVYAFRTLPFYNIFTPIHLAMADMGLCPHSDVEYLNHIGETAGTRRLQCSNNSFVYGDAGQSNAPMYIAERSLNFNQFGRSALVDAPTLQKRVSASEYDK